MLGITLLNHDFVAGMIFGSPFFFFFGGGGRF